MIVNGLQGKSKATRIGLLGSIFGFAVVGLYNSLTIIAITQYPKPVSPLTTYLSMLGNANLNPAGSIFFNLAMILGGLAEILFFVILSMIYAKIGYKFLMRIGLLAGVTNGVSILMTGVFSQSVNMDAHITWSYLIFYSLIPVLLAYNIAFMGRKGIWKPISWYGFLVFAIDIILLTTLLGSGLRVGLGSLMEWILVFAFLAWIAGVSFVLLKIDTA